MNKKVLIVVGVVAIAALGFGTWFFINKEDKPQSNSETSAAQSSSGQASEAVAPKTINGLLAAGANKKCILTTSDGSTQVTGTIYISAAKEMRGEYSSTSDGKTSAGNMIITQDVQYFWVPDSKQGIKINLSDVAANSQSTEQSSPSGLDTDKEYDFSCSDWTVDEALFVVPSDVNFMDFSGVQSQLNQ